MPPPVFYIKKNTKHLCVESKNQTDRKGQIVRVALCRMPSNRWNRQRVYVWPYWYTDMDTLYLQFWGGGQSAGNTAIHKTSIVLPCIAMNVINQINDSLTRVTAVKTLGVTQSGELVFHSHLLSIKLFILDLDGQIHDKITLLTNCVIFPGNQILDCDLEK